MTPEERVEGLALLEDATPGPWEGIPHDWKRGQVPEADAALIVWLRNHAEELLAAQEERTRLEQALVETTNAIAKSYIGWPGRPYPSEYPEIVKRARAALNESRRARGLEPVTAPEMEQARAALGDSA